MTRGDTISPGALSRRAFTLIEMMVVVAIVLVILGIALPAANSLWNNQKLSDAQNAVKGMLTTARVKAQQPGAIALQRETVHDPAPPATPDDLVVSGESGLFFFLDDSGVQRIVSIVSMAQTGRQQPTAPPNRLAYRDVFLVTAERSFSLSPPLRVVPRYVVEGESSGTASHLIFDEDELANDNYVAPANDPTQRHRNYFTMVFSSDGELRVWRDVLIRDDDVDGDGLGDLTGLPVGYDSSGPTAIVKRYYAQDGATTKIDPTDGELAIPFLIVESNRGDVAVNFPSVDGLLVYDDAVFQSYPTPGDKRSFLVRTAIPFYVNRLTGAVVRGPIEGSAP